MGGFFASQLLRLGVASIPSANAEDIQQFKATLPPGYSYAYYLDNTGYALNVEEGKIYLLGARKGSKIYDRRLPKNFLFVLHAVRNL